MSAEATYVVGVDIGGSHILSGAVSMETGQILSNTSVELKVDNKASKSSILETWAKAINGTISELGQEQIQGIGFGMPGAFNYRKGIALFEGNDKYENLYGVAVPEELTPLLATKDVALRFINDASAFAVGEAWKGLSASSHRSILLTLGTGFGSSFVQDGVPVVDGPEVPEHGCLWHLSFEQGIADEYFSTRWFVNTFFNRTGEQVLGAKEIHDKALQGDSEALQLFREFGINLSHFMDHWIRTFNPEVIIVAGNIGKAWQLIQDPFLDHLKQIGSRTKVYVSELKESAAILGSARLFHEPSWKKIQPILTEF